VQSNNKPYEAHLLVLPHLSAALALVPGRPQRKEQPLRQPAKWARALPLKPLNSERRKWLKPEVHLPSS
jgi:hypothetical protein